MHPTRSVPLFHFPLPLFALDAILPKKCKGGAMPRKLLLCFDGTWNHPDDEQKPEDQQVETNVRRIFEAALDRPRVPDQVKWYDDGIGNQCWFERLGAGAFGLGLDQK